MALDDEDEGEQFDFDDSGDDVPEADRPPPAPPAPDYTEQGMLGGECPPPPEAAAPPPAQPHPNPTPEPSQAPTMTTTTTDAAFPPPPPPEEGCEALRSVTTNSATPASTSAPLEAPLPPPHQERHPPSNAPAPETDLPPPPPEEATATATETVTAPLAAAVAPDAGQKGAQTAAVNCPGLFWADLKWLCYYKCESYMRLNHCFNDCTQHTCSLILQYSITVGNSPVVCIGALNTTEKKVYTVYLLYCMSVSWPQYILTQWLSCPHYEMN